MNLLYRTQDWGIRRHVRDIVTYLLLSLKIKLSQTDENSHFKKTTNLHHANIMQRSRSASFPHLTECVVGKLLTILHTHEFSKVKKRKSGRKIERREEVLDTRAAAQAAAHFCVSDIHLPRTSIFFFLQRIWKHRLEQRS